MLKSSSHSHTSLGFRKPSIPRRGKYRINASFRDLKHREHPLEQSHFLAADLPVPISPPVAQ